MALMARNTDRGLGGAGRGDLGCANQAGEDNRNVARMAACYRSCRRRCRAPLSTVCALGARCGRHDGARIRTGEIDFAIAGGVESMTARRSVMGKAEAPFSARRKCSTPPSAGASSILF
jgi:3-oxoadipyl-CoA thiolase